MTQLTSEDYGRIFEEHIDVCSLLPYANSPYRVLAEEIMEMVVSYRKDGLTFKSRGDLVNEHAAYAYGFGWLDLGIKSGLIMIDCKSVKTGSDTTEKTAFSPDLNLNEFAEKMPDELFEKLFEKTNRYQRMLTDAVLSVKTAPDIESPLYRFAESVAKVTECYLDSGRKHLADERYMNALAHFSYGYGLLDGAVRCGHFIITGNRDLFTV